MDFDLDDFEFECEADFEVELDVGSRACDSSASEDVEFETWCTERASATPML